MLFLISRIIIDFELNFNGLEVIKSIKGDKQL